MTIADLLGGDVTRLPPLHAADYVSIGVVLAVACWALLAWWRADRAPRRTPLPRSSRTLRLTGAMLVAAIILSYSARLVSVPPIVGRTLLFAALLAMALGYELDRRDARR